MKAKRIIKKENMKYGGNSAAAMAERIKLLARGLKYCAACDEVLPQESFAAHARKWDGLKTYCRGCINAYRQANKESIKA